MNYYVFETEEIALAADAFISMLGGAPLIGVNAKTGKSAPEKQRTVRWATPKQRLDGKWVFKKVPDNLMAQVPQTMLNQFDQEHPHVVEDYDPLWFSD